MQKNSGLVFRMLQILYLYTDYKINEISCNFNKCPKCESVIKEYDVAKIPQSNIHSWGDSPIHFDCNGILHWSITCNNCNEETSIGTQYLFDIQKGCKVTKFDFFLDENGCYGHS